MELRKKVKMPKYPTPHDVKIAEVNEQIRELNYERREKTKDIDKELGSLRQKRTRLEANRKAMIQEMKNNRKMPAMELTFTDGSTWRSFEPRTPGQNGKGLYDLLDMIARKGCPVEFNERSV